MTHPWMVFGLLLAASVVSFFLSGMEAGVLALSPVRIRHWVRKGRPRAGLLLRYLERLEDFFWTILVGNTLANVLVVGLTVWLLLEGLGDWPVAAALVAALAVFVFYAVLDLFPKVLFRAYPNRLCLSLVGVFRLMDVGLQPLVRPLRGVSGLVMGRGRGAGEPTRLVAGKEDLRLALQESNPSLTGEEKAMIGRVLDLGSLKVGSLATPLAKVVTVEAGVPMSEVMRVFRERRLSRLPVWRVDGGDRRIVGVVSVKTLLYRSDKEALRTAGDGVRPAVFLDEEMRVEEALRRLKRSGERLAVVLGPGRRETGVLSLEDILRYVLGKVTE